MFANVLSRGWRHELADRGVVAVDTVDAIPKRPDVVHGQHTLAMLSCIARFPDTPVVQWLHDRTDPMDTPLGHPSIAHYIAVDEARAARVRRAGVDDTRISVVPNAIDAVRFPFRPDGPAERRALCIIKRDGLAPTVDFISRAAARAGWAVDFEGRGVGREIRHMEAVLPRYSLVIASGRCALEALSSGAAVLVCDDNRMAGLATAATWAAMRHNNLGFDAMTEPLTDERLDEVFAAIDLEASRQFAAEVRPEIDLATTADLVAALYARVALTPVATIASDVRETWRADLARLVAETSGPHLTYWRRLAAEADGDHHASSA